MWRVEACGIGERLRHCNRGARGCCPRQLVPTCYTASGHATQQRGGMRCTSTRPLLQVLFFAFKRGKEMDTRGHTEGMPRETTATYVLGEHVIPTAAWWSTHGFSSCWWYAFWQPTRYIFWHSFSYEYKKKKKKRKAFVLVHSITQ